VTPSDITRRRLYDEGLAIAKEFLALNNIVIPRFILKDLNSTGLYYENKVFVNLPATTTPVPRPYHMRWSWPGWKTDRTAIGVVVHETGHHVMDNIRQFPHRYWNALRKKTKKISSYEPNADEAWAESMRVFILNPDLLRLAVPARYNLICSCGVQPIAKRLADGYAACLDNNPYYIEAAQKWIAAA
jgi:hypothetical protein